jgi:O-antigen ligase
MPQILSRPMFWIGSSLGVVGAGVASAAMGINPLLLVQRLSQSLDSDDRSSYVHHEVMRYGFELLGRFPLTGAGLGNFGPWYGAEMDAYFPNMMSHSAPLTYLSESGLIGGGAFLALCGYVIWRPLRALRDPRLRREQPELRAWILGLLAAVVAMDIANLFYDYYLRTFIWVVSGLAIAAARLWELRAERRIA